MDGDEELEELYSSYSSSAESTATVGKDCETTVLKCKGWGRNLGAPIADAGDMGGGEILRLSEGGVTLTEGEVTTRFIPLSTELLFPPRLQEEAESDLEGAEL